jgi:hypothetical protein
MRLGGPSVDLQVDIKNVPILIEGKNCRGIIVAERDSDTEDDNFEPGLHFGFFMSVDLQRTLDFQGRQCRLITIF